MRKAKHISPGSVFKDDAFVHKPIISQVYLIHTSYYCDRIIPIHKPNFYQWGIGQYPLFTGKQLSKILARNAAQHTHFCKLVPRILPGARTNRRVLPPRPRRVAANTNNRLNLSAARKNAQSQTPIHQILVKTRHPVRNEKTSNLSAATPNPPHPSLHFNS